MTTGYRRTHQVGDFVIELLPGDDEHHLKLRSLSAEADGLPCEMIVHLSEVRSLACALLNAAADLVGMVVSE